MEDVPCPRAAGHQPLGGVFGPGPRVICVLRRCSTWRSMGSRVPLNAVDSNGEGINQIEALAVLGQDRREVAGEGHVRAREHAIEK